MCGITGVFSTHLPPQALRAAAEQMQAALVHRGPDDAGLWGGEQAALAHQRLSILDLSAAARQPMSTPDGRFHLSFNGEIYNFRELRNSLEKEGACFHTNSDTEVILELYVRYKAGCVQQLRGMFAFAIWDSLERTAFLARDPLGIKPLYLHERDGTLAFASELRALRQSRLFVPTLSTRAVQRYFESGSVPEPLTLINECFALGAGETLLWRDGKSTRHTYWQLHFNAEIISDPVRHTREALLDSVRHHFVSDVPVGVFLSGGIDSTAILALANATGHRGLSACSIAVDEAAADESATARRSATHFGADYHEMRLNAEAAQGLFGRYLEHVDQPTIDGLNTFAVSSLARENGLKVVLSGLGGDELFGGYSSFTKIPRMMRWHKALRFVPGVATMLARGQSRHRRMADYLRSPGSAEDAFAALRGIFSKEEARQLTQWITGCDSAITTEIPGPCGGGTVQDRISSLEITRYMRNQLLRDSDVMSMAHGLELRVPLVDRTLFEAVARIPASRRLLPGKRLLTEAVPEVPEWVVNQPKRGFLFPYQKWLGGEWGEAFAKGARGAPVEMPSWYQQWSLFVLRHSMARLGLAS
ncbi:MAG: hypothetical protein JWO94_3245 [Verrucomicrobiaceae bacterium]|nr:hypothetical protein [Verrucomicrobiaceae bacterium]